MKLLACHQKINRGLTMKTQLAFGLLLLILIAACTSVSKQTPQTQQTTPTAPTGCNDKDCFISAANDCKEISITLNEEVGVFKYTASKNCIFTKTLVSVNNDETPEMKKLLTGKSLICKYEQRKFDQRLVTSLFWGTEYCEGELKDILGKLIVFA